jgi:hypothetical protein
VPAGVTVPIEHVLPDVPEVLLRSVLIVCSPDLRIPDLLDIECGHFHNDFRHGDNALDLLDDLEVGVELVLDGGSQPPLGFLPVQEPGLPVPGLAVSTGPPILLPFCIQFHQVGPQADFCDVQLPLPTHRRNANPGIAAIDTQDDRLPEARAAKQQPDGEWSPDRHFRFALREKRPRFGRMTRHEGQPLFI